MKVDVRSIDASTMQDAVQIAIKYAVRGDSILLSPASPSYDMYKNYQIRGKDFKNAIEKYYENPDKYAFSFQMMAYISRIHQLRETLATNNNVIIICERSVFTDKEIFAKMLHGDGLMDDIMYNIYERY